MSKININILLLIAIIMGVISGCDDMETIHEEYLMGEKIYAGKLDSLIVYSGYNRVKIVGQTKYIGNSTECIVAWGDQEQVFPINEISSGMFEVYIENLEERSYEFTVYTKDSEGNSSILQTTKGKAIGGIFKDSQMHRRITGYVFSGAYFSANWADKAESPYVVSTFFSYETNNGQMKTIEVASDDVSVPLFNWKAGGKLEILSKIITGEQGIDTVALDVVEGVLPTESVFELDKSYFTEVHLTNDTYGTGYGGVFEKIWDGDRNGFGYHTGDGEGVPHSLTFDLGVQADLVRFRLDARQDFLGWNPKKVQLWGCADIDGKDTELPGMDPGWEDEAKSKGWKLITEAYCPDDITNTIEIDSENAKGIRYVRYRPVEVVNGAGAGAYGGLFEITFWGENIVAVD